MKKFTSIILCVLLAVMAIFTMISCEKEEGSPSYVSIDINPSIELTVDAENKVVSVYAANEDANVLLYEETGIVGADIEGAIAKITELAIELGYIDETNKVVGTTISSENADWVATLQEKVNTKITATAKEAGLNITTDGEGAYSVLRQLEAFKAKYPENEAIQNLSINKFKLALSASENGEITLESAVELDDKALIDLVSTTHKQIEVFATEAYEQVKQQAFAIYDELAGIAVDGVYGEYYIKNILSHPTTCWYGHTYQMYKTTARGFDAIADALVFVERIQNYELTEEQVTNVLSALGLTADQRAEIEDKDGKVTLDSVYAYADKKFKNTPASAELEAMKAELDSALDTVESVASEKIQQAVNEHKDEIETAVEASKKVMDTVLSLLPAPVKATLEAQNAEYNKAIDELIAVFESGTASQAKMRECANTMNTLAEEMLAKIKEDLSEDELKEIDATIEQRKATLDSYRATMEQTIATFEQELKAELSALKAQREQKATETPEN
ncbi:MAG: hypothetical protein IJF11_02230 [Clostridia bacterium]|nr:hypothetical protein [Clostridia bacterium]